MAVQVRLLGTVSAAVDGADVALSSTHRLLLCRLAIAGGPVTTDELRSLLGGIDSPVTASTVKSHISRLRASLGDAGCIRSVPGGYHLAIGRVKLDRERFEELLASAVGAPQAVAARRLANALALWQGPAFGDLGSEEFALPEAARLEELRLQTFESRASALLWLGRHEQVVSELERITRLAPIRERLHGQLAMALAGLGRQAEAIRVLASFRRTLAEETGLEVSADTVELEQRIFTGDSSISPPAPARVDLPAMTTPLVGRQDDIARVARVLQDRRLVSIVGLGGAGKTRLALGAAALALDDFGAGVIHLDLARATDGSSVVPLLAEACRLPARSLDELVTLLRDHHVLVVLDGCEHVIDEIRGAIAAILTRAPSVHVLATSRIEIGVQGEQITRLLGLPDDDAAALLTARAADAGVSIDPSDPSTRRLVRALDGLPLAIELAAPRLTHLSPDALMHAIDGRFELLRATPDGRHASLRALLDDTVEDLRDADRVVLDAAGTFVGSFPAAAVAHVAGGIDPNESLGELVRRSLVVSSPVVPRTFRLLDTVRAHTRARAASSETQRLLRHAAWFVEEAVAVDEARAAWSIEHAVALRRWQPDIELAIRTLLESDPPSAARLLAGTAALWRNGSGAHFDFARAALERVLVGDLPPDVAAACHGLASFLARMQVDQDGSGRHARAGIALITASGWRPWCFGALALHLVVRGVVAQSTELIDEAQRSAEEAAAGAADVATAWRLPIAWDVANVAFTIGDIGAAHASLAGALAEAGGSEELAAEELLVRASDAAALHLLDRDRDAHDIAKSALALSHTGSDDQDGWLARQPLAFLAPAIAAGGEPRRAISLLLNTLPAAAEIATVLNVSDFIVALGAVYGTQQEWETSGRLLGAARALGRRHSIPFRTPIGYAIYRHWNARVREAVGPERGRVIREHGASLGYAAVLASVQLAPTGTKVDAEPRNRAPSR